MTPVFWILVALWRVLIWASLAGLFKFIGKYVLGLLEEIKKAFKEDDKDG